jgi:energy-converting hydrogenase Eha subunit A
MWMVGYVVLSIAAVIVSRVMEHRRVRRSMAPSTGYPPPVIHGWGK